MHLAAKLLASILLFHQDAPSEHVRSLIAKLSSSKLEEREEAMEKLVSLREEAEPALKKAVTGDDKEVHARAQNALKAIALIRDCRLEDLWKTSPRLVWDLVLAEGREDWIDRLAPIIARLSHETRQALAGEILKDKAAIERLRDLGGGARAGQADDVWFCKAALESDHGEASKAACLAFEKIVKVIPSGEGPEIGRKLAERVSAEDKDTSEFAGRALCQLAEAGILGDAVEPTGKMGFAALRSEDIEDQRRGANLVGGIASVLPDSMVDEAVEELLKAEARLTPRDRGEVTYKMLMIALSSYGKRATSPKVRESLADRYLVAFAGAKDSDWYFSPRYSALSGMSTLVANLEGELRNKVLKAIISSVSDRSFIYMTTSGRASPHRHRGAEALLAVASLLDDGLRREASNALENAIQAENDQDVLKALHAARHALEND